MAACSMYPIKIDNPLYYSLRALKVLCSYPVSQKRIHICLLITFGGLWRICAFFILTIGLTSHMYMSSRGNNSSGKSEDMTFISLTAASLIGNTAFPINYKTWSELYKLMINFDILGKPTRFNKTVKRTNLFSLLYIVYIIFATGTYALAKLAVRSSCRRRAELDNQPGVCAMLPIWQPFNISDSMVFLAQFTSMLFVLLASGIMMAIYIEVAEVFVAHVDHLRENMGKIFEQKDKEKRKKHISLCIRYHQFIIKLGEDYNGSLRVNIGYMSFAWPIVYSCIINQLVNEKLRSNQLVSVLVLVGFSVAVFSPCYAGQLLFSESLSVADCISESGWYRGTIVEQKSIQFMLLRSQKPIIVRAIPFGVYNYALFLAIIKTAYSYVTLLSNYSE